MLPSQEISLELLCEIIKTEPIDWGAFDEVLDRSDNLNGLDEDNEETLLSEVLACGEFYHNGTQMANVIRHFLDHGYNVSANNGKNGGLCLSQLCWCAYDKYILDAAKVLLDAGAPVIYDRTDDEPGFKGVMRDIDWKIGGAWVVNGDYTWANILEAYTAIIEAVEAQQEYRDISSFLDCIGCELSSVSLIAESDGLSKRKKSTDFSGKLVFWLDEKPLVISKYIELTVNPYFVSENSSILSDVSEQFMPILGGVLKKVQYVNQSICYFDFDNGYRVIFSAIHSKGALFGSYEIRCIKPVDVSKLQVRDFCFWDSTTYYSEMNIYNVEALALFSNQNAYLAFSYEQEPDDKFFVDIIECSKEMLVDFTRKLPVESSAFADEFFFDKKRIAIRFQCGECYLYTQAHEYLGLEVKVSKENVCIEEPTLLRRLSGLNMDLRNNKEEEEDYE